MEFFRKLSAMKPDMRKGHVLLAELVAAGEVPVGPHDVQQQHQLAQAQGRADRLRAGAAGGRAPPGHRRRDERAAPARGAAVRRFRALARGPAALRVDGPRPASRKVKSASTISRSR